MKCLFKIFNLWTELCLVNHPGLGVIALLLCLFCVALNEYFMSTNTPLFCFKDAICLIERYATDAVCNCSKLFCFLLSCAMQDQRRIDAVFHAVAAGFISANANLSRTMQ